LALAIKNCKGLARRDMNFDEEKDNSTKVLEEFSFEIYSSGT